MSLKYFIVYTFYSNNSNRINSENQQNQKEQDENIRAKRSEEINNLFRILTEFGDSVDSMSEEDLTEYMWQNSSVFEVIQQLMVRICPKIANPLRTRIIKYFLSYFRENQKHLRHTLEIPNLTLLNHLTNLCNLLVTLPTRHKKHAIIVTPITKTLQKDSLTELNASFMMRSPARIPLEQIERPSCIPSNNNNNNNNPTTPTAFLPNPVPKYKPSPISIQEISTPFSPTKRRSSLSPLTPLRYPLTNNPNNESVISPIKSNNMSDNNPAITAADKVLFRHVKLTPIKQKLKPINRIPKHNVSGFGKTITESSGVAEDISDEDSDVEIENL